MNNTIKRYLSPKFEIVYLVEKDTLMASGEQLIDPTATGTVSSQGSTWKEW